MEKPGCFARADKVYVLRPVVAFLFAVVASSAPAGGRWSGAVKRFRVFWRALRPQIGPRFSPRPLRLGELRVNRGGWSRTSGRRPVHGVRCRQPTLAKDFEVTVESAVTWHYIVSVKLMSRRLAAAW